MPPLFGASFDDWANAEHESSYWIEDNPFDNWLNASDSLSAPNRSDHNFDSLHQGTPFSPEDQHFLEPPQWSDSIQQNQHEQVATFQDPEPAGSVTFALGCAAEDDQHAMSHSKCVQCREAQYVNRQGLCMVCQYYAESNRSNDVWKPRTGIPDHYKSRNSSSSSLESVNSIDSTTSASSAGSRRGRRVPGGYPCRESGCDMAFDVPSDLRHHQRKHTAKRDRPYACSCGERFSYPKDLRRHSRNVHQDSISLVNTVYEVPQPYQEQSGVYGTNSASTTPILVNEKKRRADSPSRDSSHSVKSLVQRSKYWIKIIDELLYSKKGYRDHETSTAVEQITTQLDQLDVKC